MTIDNRQIPPSGFKSHFSFAMAKEFYDTKTHEKFQYEQNGLEKVGRNLRWLIWTVADKTFKEITNPVAIIGTSLVAAVGVTIAYYPDEFFSIVPLVRYVTPAMVQAGLYVLVQGTILGAGLHAIGHFTNKPLMEKWQKGEIYPIHIGDKRV